MDISINVDYDNSDQYLKLDELDKFLSKCLRPKKETVVLKVNVTHSYPDTHNPNLDETIKIPFMIENN